MLVRLNKSVRTVFWAVWFTVPYIVIVAVTGAALGWFDQTLELYRAFAQEPLAHSRYIVTSIVLLFLLTYLLWFVIKDTMESDPESRSTGPGLLAWYLRIFPCIALALPAATARGLLIAGWGDPALKFSGDDITGISEDLFHHPHVLQISAIVVAVLAVVFLLTAVLSSDSLAPGPLRTLVRYRYFPLGFLPYLGLAVLILIWPLPVTRFFGAIALILIFMSCLTLVVRFFYNSSPYVNAGYLSILAVWVTVFWVGGWDDYTVKPKSQKLPHTYGTAKDAFQEWFYKRGDKDNFNAQKPYPVFLVAASGGGLYAARHTAITLARLQDRCPGFAQHVFAISGISGGSWGAAIFNRLANKMAPNSKQADCVISNDVSPAREKGPFETKTDEILAGDFLSPLIGVGLYPNMLQPALPRSVRRLNRSAIFERVIEEPWGADNPFAQTVASSWDPGGPAGALLLNMTDADEGYQTIAGPFNVRGRLHQSGNAFQLVEKFLNPPLSGNSTSFQGIKDLTISSAVALSAGFPIVIGAGYLKKTDDGRQHRLRLVDGGYYENSGVETLLQVIEQLKDFEGILHEISIHVIVLDSRYPAGDEQDVLLSPIKALLQTRTNRAQVAITNLYGDRSEIILHKIQMSRLCEKLTAGTMAEGCKFYPLPIPVPAGCACKKVEVANSPGDREQFGNLRPIQVSLDLSTFEVPLAFYLSHNATAVVDGFSGNRFCDAESSRQLSTNDDMRDKWSCGNANLCRGPRLLAPGSAPARSEMSCSQ